MFKSTNILRSSVSLLRQPLSCKDVLKLQSQWIPTASLSATANSEQFKSDVLIIGGGIMGLSTAFWIKHSSPSTSVTVIEKDPKYTTCSTTRAVGGIRSHFSLPENIKLSLHSFDFLTKINDYLNVDPDDLIDIALVRKGYLYLATESGVDTLVNNHKIQKSCGASVELLDPQQLSVRWPWLNTNGIAAGSYGFDKEGWFDPHRLLMAFRAKALALGVKYVHGIVTDFSCSCETPSCKVNGAIVDHIKQNSQAIYSAESIVIAGGSECGALSNKLVSQNAKSILCPVNPRKRYVYSFKCETLNGQNFPMLIDPSGVYCRGDGDNYITGLSPEESEEPQTTDFEVDYDFFDQRIWPQLAERVKPFESIKVLSAWAGYYDFNELDENAIMGQDPVWSNLYWLTGFSGHGIQMGPAAGKCISELILNGKYSTVDCTRFRFNRAIEGEKLLEVNII
ncbi:FAD-dependent oxidoreductase domain-containing protein 1 [Tetranychus urticae]|uniref:FAD-dependent oxidoreductase domain-containing protein 1 n=1 Tax=Tetranychus urticae TaxID=32264 RepID=T1KLJ1_TETUR|nr:FAD-dependent oxidoreductase domain-containing protein 1 [Tetranychus urticae]